MLASMLLSRGKTISKANARYMEQFTLTVSFWCVFVLVVGSLGYGLYIGSEVVIANGIFSLYSLLGSGLNLMASKLVARKEDSKFQYGYWHVEPLVLFINGLLLLGICFFAIINSIENIRLGGNTVDSDAVIWFGVVSGLLCGFVWLFESIVARRIGSNLVKNDSKEWLLDFLFSMATFIGFFALRWLDEPLYSYWAKYADSALVIIMALLLAPLPMRVVIANVREILLMTERDDPVSCLINDEMEQVKNEYAGIVSFNNHVVKVGRSYFVEVNILVTPEFPLQTITQQDDLRQRLWTLCHNQTGELWLSVCITEKSCLS